MVSKNDVLDLNIVKKIQWKLVEKIVFEKLYL